jgi:predicted DNA-binding WGR domain protein
MRPKQLEKWHFLFMGLAIVGVVLWPLSQWLTALKGSFIMITYFAAAVGIFGILQILSEMVKNISQQQERIEQISELLTANKNLLEQISQGVRLSEAAKTICYRDTDRQQLRASVMETLHLQDFEATYAMIDGIARRQEYQQLAADLKLTADKYRNATDQDRVGQVINYIDRLLEQHQWANAETQIERLIKKYPDSEKAKEMNVKLFEKKEKRKRELLDEWDTAVKKADVDHSLEVLHELDFYLTPSEGLALQEAASEIFKNKLHNMGVQFSLAVSDKQWEKALQTGQAIIKEFPNSKMADEIRSKTEILQELAKKAE